MRLRRDSLFCLYFFSESKISAPAERKFGICACGANRFFFKASPASGAALKDKGLKLKSEHRKNITVNAVLTVVVQIAEIKIGTPRVEV